MSQKNKHITPWLKNLFDYLSNRFTGKERNLFERNLEKNNFEADAFEGFQVFSEKEILSDLDELKGKLSKRLKKESKFPFMKLAAGIAVIIALSVSYFVIFNHQVEDLPGNYNLSETSQKLESEKSVKVADSLTGALELQENSSLKVSDMKKPITEKVIPNKSSNVYLNDTEKEDKLDENADPGILELSSAEAIEISAPTEEYLQPEKAVQSEYVISDNKVNQPSVPVSKSEMSAKKSKAKSSKIIKGKVISGEDSLPLPGVSIQIRGLAVGTITDSEGNFEIEKPREEGSIVASMIGMNSEERDIKDDSNVEIVMQQNATNLDEVVVGYGSNNYNQLSGTTSEKSSSELNPENNFSEAYPKGGYGKFKDYIKENIRFPEKIVSLDRAVVILKTTIDKKGKPTNIHILKSPDEAFTKEAIRLLKEGPKWEPSTRDGKYIPNETRIRIVLKKEE